MRPQIDNNNDAAKRPTKFVGGAGHFAARGAQKPKGKK